MKLKKHLKRFSRNPDKRKKAVWRDLRDTAQRYGFEMYKSHLNWLADDAFLAAKKEWADIPGLAADRAFFLFSTARAIRNIPGETADIGVRYGSSSFYMLRGLGDASRPHHIFDSFEGLSAPSAEDRDTGGKAHWKQGDIAVGEEVTRQSLNMFSHCHYYKGWVPARFSEVADKRFAFVHVDVDLYEPTLQTLQFFYERMNPGGVIVCDDYGSSMCPGATKALNEFFAGKESVIHIPTGQSLVVKR